MELKLTTHGDKFILDEAVSVDPYNVPKGFVTDFATIPRWALSFLGRPTRKQYRLPSLVHDYLLKSGKVTPGQAHEIFYSLLLDNGVKSRSAYIMYLAVKYFGIFKKLKQDYT